MEEVDDVYDCWGLWVASAERRKGDGVAGVVHEYSMIWIRLTLAGVIGRGLVVKMVQAEHLSGRSGQDVDRPRV